MRLILALHTAYPQFIGGREHHVHGLARGLARRHEVFVVSGGLDPRPRQQRVRDYTLITLPMRSIRVSSSPLQLYRVVPGFNRALRRLRPDLVHAFEYGSYTTDLAALHCARHGLPLLLTVYGYVFHRSLLRAGKRLYDRTFGRWLLRRAERVFYPSDEQRDELLAAAGARLGPQLRARLVWRPNSFLPLPPPDPGLTGQLRRRHRRPGQRLALVVARLLPRKGLDTLLDALARIDGAASRRLRLLVVGPDCGSRGQLQRQAARLGLQDRVCFEGSVPYDRVSAYFHLCDLFVLPSWYEGLPLALLEAMWCGKPAVFSDIPCARRVLRHDHDALLVPPRDPRALARALTRLLDDEALGRRLGRAARRTAAELTCQAEVEALELVYRDVLARRAGAGGAPLP